MLVVAGASVLVPALADPGPHGEAARTWLTELAGSEQLHVLHTLSQLELISSVRTLVATGRLDEPDAERALRDYIQLPAVRHEVTQPMVARIWELRGHLNPYDAAYVALVERLTAEGHGPACLATGDEALCRTPGLSIEVRLFVD